MSVQLTVPDLSHNHVLVVGDVMLDQYWFGAVDRISPEAPVPIVAVKNGEIRGGGAANVALNVANLGAKCTLLSIAGDDHHARELEQMLGKAGINVILIKAQNYSTTVKQRVISHNQQLIRLDFEQKPNSRLLARCYEQYQELIGTTKTVIFSDYGKGTLEHITDMIIDAENNQIPVAVDPKGRDYSRYARASLITPNFSEFIQVVGNITDDNQMDEKAVELVNELKIEQLLITLSERGMKLYTNHEKIHFSPAHAREVYDVSGAGDTVIACMGALLASKLSKQSILEIANAAAGVVVAKLGTAVADVNEINTALLRAGEQT